MALPVQQMIPINQVQPALAPAGVGLFDDLIDEVAEIAVPVIVVQVRTVLIEDVLLPRAHQIIPLIPNAAGQLAATACVGTCVQEIDRRLNPEMIETTTKTAAAVSKAGCNSIATSAVGCCG